MKKRVKNKIMKQILDIALTTDPYEIYFTRTQRNFLSQNKSYFLYYPNESGYYVRLITAHTKI